MNSPNQLTVKDLAQLCAVEIKNGNGNKMVVISDDNEGNGFHGLFYGFTADCGPLKELIFDSQAETPDKVIVLG